MGPSRLTRPEWDAEWEKNVNRLFFQQGYTFPEASRLGRRMTEIRYGPQPQKPPGPPLWMKLGALAIGVKMDFLKTIWERLSSHKTVIGLVLVQLPILLPQLEQVLVGVGVADATKWVGVALTVVGILHKAYKVIFGEEPKKA